MVCVSGLPILNQGPHNTRRMKPTFHEDEHSFTRFDGLLLSVVAAPRAAHVEKIYRSRDPGEESDEVVIRACERDR